MRGSRRGFTLIEVTIAVTLIGLLALGLLMAMRVGFNAMEKSNNRLMHNRRVAGVERVLEQQVAGILPVAAKCAANNPDGPGTPFAFFQGEPQSMRFVSSYSLQEASRGLPRILEYQVIPGEHGEGVRLVVNEGLYSGPLSAGFLCLSLMPDGEGHTTPMFRPIAVGPGSFVLADKLANCQFLFLAPAQNEHPAHWVSRWTKPVLPDAIHIEMTPLEPDASSMQLLPLTIPVRVTRLPLEPYAE